MMTEIPLQEIQDLVNILKTELPHSIFMINLLETCRKWKQKNEKLNISLLYDNNANPGVFVAILKSGSCGSVVSMYALDSYENQLEEVLHSLQVDWDTVIEFVGIVEKHFSILDKFIKEKSLNILMVVNLLDLSMPIEKALELKIECPEDIVLAPLSESHLDEIYEDWILKNMFKKDYLKYCLLYNDEAAHGVFCKATGQVLARCLRGYSGALAALQTLPEARNKGYAKLLLKYLAKNLASKGIHPYSYTADFNATARKVFCGAGFEEVGRMRSYEMNMKFNTK